MENRAYRENRIYEGEQDFNKGKIDFRRGTGSSFKQEIRAYGDTL
jgi:hypothetical protein